MDDDEDVILQSTELGKYLETHNVFGHFDLLPSQLTDEISEFREGTEENLCHVHATYWFICGQNLPDLIVNPIFKLVCFVKYSYTLLGRKQWEIPRWVKLLQAWKVTKPGLSKAEQVAFKFSLEHRLTTETSKLMEYSTQIDSSVAQLNLLIHKLQFIKSSRKTVKCNEILTDIGRIRRSISDNLGIMEKLLIYQGNSLERFSRRINGVTQSVKLTEAEQVDQIQTVGTDVVDPHNFECEVASSDQLVFENEVPEKFYDEDRSVLQRDEIFELNMENTFHELVENSRVDEDALSQEVKIIQAELLAQLRRPLSSRRADMEVREARAYLELYGKPMEKSEDSVHDIRVLPHPVPNIGPVQSKVEPEVLPNELALTGAEESFGDEVDELESQQVKTEFLASLQTLLRNRRGS